MSNLLAEICHRKREYVAACQQAVSLTVLEQTIRTLPAPLPFAQALARQRSAGQFGLIAEMKRVSPSAGMIRPDFDPAAIALDYAKAGATCLSVLTDQPYFKGRDSDVAAAKAASLPILRKDFMVDVYQVAEARAIGADCILLIMAVLDDTEAATLHSAAKHYGLDILIETHDEAEMERALRLPSGMIGINNRNLSTLKTDLATTARLAKLVPQNRVLVSESGIRTHSDIQMMTEYGVSSFLVGEHLLKQPDLIAATQSLLGVS
jgi:indole-3-glycerol phosphate synthase